MGLNKVEITGVVKEQNDEYAIIKHDRKSGKSNSVMIWDLPRKLKVGEAITVKGELESRGTGYSISQSILGVKASSIECATDEIGRQSVAFTGTIVSKAAERTTPVEKKRIVEFKIRMDNNTVIYLAVWGNLIDSTLDCKAGDEVTVTGYILSRMYIKRRNGYRVSKLTTEVNATQMWKVQV